MSKYLAQFPIYRRLSSQLYHSGHHQETQGPLSAVAEGISVKGQSQHMCAKVRGAEASRV